MSDIGKVLILLGVFMVALGLLLMAVEKLPLGLGRLPGDIVFKRGNFTFYFPIETFLILSVLLTLILNLLFSLKK